MILTARTKLGFGYSTSPNGTGPYGIHAPTRPVHVGTYRQIMDALGNDRALKAFAGGTCYSRQWFARSGGGWVPISFDTANFDLHLAGEGSSPVVTAKVLP